MLLSLTDDDCYNQSNNNFFFFLFCTFSHFYVGSVLINLKIKITVIIVISMTLIKTSIFSTLTCITTLTNTIMRITYIIIDGSTDRCCIAIVINERALLSGSD